MEGAIALVYSLCVMCLFVCGLIFKMSIKKNMTMNKTKLLNTVALRYRSLCLDIDREQIDSSASPTPSVLIFCKFLNDCGYGAGEELLHALSLVGEEELDVLTSLLGDTLGLGLNWSALVKGWLTPTGELCADHVFTWLANVFGREGDCPGTTLPCGHFIPDGTFPLERYTGCPFCGKPFVTDGRPFMGQDSRLKELKLMTDADMRRVFHSLLASVVPLDATQQDSLRLLLRCYPLPAGVQVGMKETVALVVRQLVDEGRDGEAAALFQTPTDILRYLWFEKTGQTQLVEPRTLVANARRHGQHLWLPADRSWSAAVDMKEHLRLKYSRKECRRVASWINGLPLAPASAAELMNAKRGMWVRMIRALRLSDYARRDGFGRLAALLDVFYRGDYATWQGLVDEAARVGDRTRELDLLKQRPGAFARCLFSTMLRLGSAPVLAAFREVAGRLPSRLLFSLGNAAELYFDAGRMRPVRTVTGKQVALKPNKRLEAYTSGACLQMAESVKALYKESLMNRYARTPQAGKTMYVDPRLDDVPVAVADRSATVQDMSCALPGTKFPVAGDAVRLFMQWGKDLPAQHLDMDLSCRISFAGGRREDCAFYNLEATGACHSGDIRAIPDRVGTAEYIELRLPELRAAGARYVTFTCNAYSCGNLSPNLMVGWMDAAEPMRVSERNGVAYDPSCVQHVVRISESNLSKGLVFGILLVESREILWLEMPQDGQTLCSLHDETVEAFIDRLSRKIKVGSMLRLKAQAQGMVLVERPEEADECYDYEWALNPAAVAGVLLEEAPA